MTHKKSKRGRLDLHMSEREYAAWHLLDRSAWTGTEAHMEHGVQAVWDATLSAHKITDRTLTIFRNGRNAA